MAADTPWSITAEEKRGYDKQFEQLAPSGGFVKGEQAKTLFLKSSLPPTVLRQIWELADTTSDGKMDKQEFAIAMKLIKLTMQGVTLPKTLPPTMRKQPATFDISLFAQSSLTPSTSAKSVFDGLTTAVNITGTSSLTYTPSSAVIKPSMSNGTSGMVGLGLAGMTAHSHGFMSSSSIMPTASSALPLSMTVPRNMGLEMSSVPGIGSTPVSNVVQQPNSPGSEWAVSKPSKLRYNQMFNFHDSNKTGYLSGMQARFILKQKALPEPVLAQIWDLSDIDKDGRLTQEEFVLAMHLTDVAIAGGIIPNVLPGNLVPPSYRRATGASSMTQLPLISNLSNSVQPDKALETDSSNFFATFEDKRRANFNKGNIELERRRQALEESQRKEKERLEKKEREEREKREKEKQEQEKRRQAQLERQLEMQLAAEREKEEARKKAIEQREAAQREMERQRRLEWERLRRQELLQHKLREQEVVTSLHAKTKELDVEIAALEEKRVQLKVRVLDVEARENDYKSAMESMDKSRDSKLSAVVKRQDELKALNDKLHGLLPEKQKFLERVSSNDKGSENTETYSSLRTNRDARQLVLSKLRSTVENNGKQAASKLIQLEKLNMQLNHLREDLNKHRLEVDAINRVQQDKVRDLQEARQAKEASLTRRNSLERIKREQQKSAAGTFMKMKELKEQEIAEKITNKGKENITLSRPTESKIPKSAEEELKKEDVKRKIAAMQQKRLEHKKQQVSEKKTLLPSIDKSDLKNSIASSLTITGAKHDQLTRFRVLYAFQARNPDELTINEGDIVLVDENDKAEPGWYSGVLNDNKGWFPLNYVERISEADATNPVSVEKGTIKATLLAVQPAQLTKENRTNSPLETIHSGEKSAFSSTGRDRDTSPVPGEGKVISGLLCQALYPWQAKKSNHLTFEKDAIIKVSEQQATWWHGSCNGKSGWFPKSYVKEVETEGDSSVKMSMVQKRKAPAPPQATAVTPSTGSSSGTEYEANYTFASNEAGDLNFEAGEIVLVTGMDGDWWTGSCGGQSGIFPANYVVPRQKEQPAPAAHQASSSREIANVIASYTASAPNQLSLKMGQLVLIKKKNESGWWEGELQVRGKKKQVGWFPANYVKIRTPGQVKTKTLCEVMAMYDYAAQNDDEITFSRGAVICVTDRSDMDWWKGHLKTNTSVNGLFPSNYVREMGQTDGSDAQWAEEQRSMSPEEIRRQQHIHELIVSEESYLKDLEMANTGFQIPLKEREILTEREMNTLFVNWNELIMCSAKLVNAFRVRKKNSGSGAPGAMISLIGDILCEQLPQLQPYVRFCSCQLNASTLLQEKIDSDTEFKKFVKSCEGGSEFKGLPVSSYLVKPMQRITKYPLLIEKILKHTPEGHVDHNHLKLALERAEEICSQVNEGVRQKENADRLEWLQTHVQLDGLNDKLVFNSATNCLGQRRLLHCGTLYKQKSNKELVGFLFNDFLLFTTATRPLNIPVNDFIFSSKSNLQFRLYKMPIFLNEVLIRLPTDPSPSGNNISEDDLALFHLSHVDRVYTLRAENVNERTAWTNKIKDASQLYIDTEKKKREKAYQARSQRTTGIGRLMVHVVEGCNLVKSSIGRNDPYCEVTMGVQSHTTKTVQDTLNPKWGTTMQFFVKDIMEDVLCISVFQRDMFSPDDFLGRTEINVADIKRDTAKNKGPLTKRLLLHEVESGEVVVKVDLQLFNEDA